MAKATEIPAKFTDANIKQLPVPGRGYKIYVEKPHSSYVPGFGVRTSPKGPEEFRYVLSYRNRAGTTRRYVIGRCGVWNAKAARDEARRLRRMRDEGGDPSAEEKAQREAETIDDLFREFDEVHLSTKSKVTRRDYRSWYEKWIRKALGRWKLSEVTYRDVRQLHQKVTNLGKPHTANRVVATLSSMYGFARREQIFDGNPCQGVPRNTEEGRLDFLNPQEVVALSKTINGYHDETVANILKLIILTGARSGETRSATWDQFNLEAGTWTKPSHHTKQKRTHRVPLSPAALELLTEMKEKADPDEPHLFPGGHDGHRGDIQREWREICKQAGLVKTVDGRTVHKYRIHDLRHTFAATLASGKQSLPIIGALLGHTQAQTTQRYAHLLDDPLREATTQAGAVLSGKDKGKLVSLPKRSA